MLTIIPVLQFSTTASVFVVLPNVMPLSANLGWCISQQGPPLLQDAPYLENDVLGIPFLEYSIYFNFKKTISKFYFSNLNVENWRRMFDLSVFKQCTRDSWHYCCVVMSVFWCFSARGVGEGALPFADVISGYKSAPSR